MTDHDQPNQRLGHSTTGEAGGTSAVSVNGREVAANPASVEGARLFGQVVTGLVVAQVQRSGSEFLTRKC
jgi:hypothetical protein